MKDRSEQWKLSGKCSLCRRKNYCGKPCTANKRRAQSELSMAVSDALAKLWLK